jgi:hypothetical protein
MIRKEDRATIAEARERTGTIGGSASPSERTVPGARDYTSAATMIAVMGDEPAKVNAAGGPKGEGALPDRIRENGWLSIEPAPPMR